MRWGHKIRFGVLMLLGPVICLPSPASAQASKVDNERLFEELQAAHGLSNNQMESVRKIFHNSAYIGQGNPAITRHPMTPQDCREKLARLAVQYENGRFEKICGAKYMAPLYNPGTEKAEAASTCIDQFEYPDIPCVYPVVWVRAREAAEICRAMGKRLCDAHEWEGACAGVLEPPDYRFDLARNVSPNLAVERMRQAHNRKYAAGKSWAYGDRYEKGRCACSSTKTQGCTGGSWTGCGSNTFPAGSFPDCHSSLGVYDLHGNAAEHMNLPLAEDQMSSRGSTTLGYTEMKGSWFIFDTYYAHPDWCRWRAPFWHGSKVMDADSHHNYHLGFRCCKTVTGPRAAGQGNLR
jgi:hypothetical protein